MLKEFININIEDTVYWRVDDIVYYGIVYGFIDGVKNKEVIEVRSNENVNYSIWNKEVLFVIPKGWLKSQSMCSCYDNFHKRIVDLLKVQITENSFVVLKQNEPLASFLQHIYQDIVYDEFHYRETHHNCKNQRILFMELPPRHGKTTLCMNLIKYFLENNNNKEKINNILFIDDETYRCKNVDSLHNKIKDYFDKDYLLTCAQNFRITGWPNYNADVIIIDDVQMAKHCEDLDKRITYISALIHNHLSSDGKVIFVGSRFEDNDFMGQMEKASIKCEVWKYPVWNRWHKEPLWPEKWTKDMIEGLRHQMGSLNFRWQYMCGLNMLWEER